MNFYTPSEGIGYPLLPLNPRIPFYTILQSNLFSYSTPNLHCSCHMLPNSSCSTLLDTFLRLAMNVSIYDKSGITLISRPRENTSRILKIISDIICPQQIAELVYKLKITQCKSLRICSQFYEETPIQQTGLHMYRIIQRISYMQLPFRKFLRLSFCYYGCKTTFRKKIERIV